MAGRDVFISYSRDDRSAAKYFAQCLSDEGFTVWWDAALHSGESFDQVIERELRAASAAIVLWSPRSVASRWVRAEATLADRLGKLIPVIIEACERPIIFELTHTNDLADWVGDKADPRWKALVSDVSRLVEQNPRKAVPATLPPPVRGVADSSAAPRPFKANSPGSARPLQAATPGRVTEDDSQATQFFVGGQNLDIFHCLEINGGEQSDQRFVVTPQGLKIGRAPPADIILSDRQVSRSHCRVELSGSVLRISDLNSTNGTFIDGKRIDGSGDLPVGSVLRVGNVSLHHQVRTSRTLEGRKVAVR